MSNTLPDCFYRVSVKALVLNDERNKFLIVKEINGRWELPGGGLDWGYSPQEDLKREIKEEMGVETTWIAEHPSYVLADVSGLPQTPRINILYETTFSSFVFTPSDECVEVRFVNSTEAQVLDLYENVRIFSTLFDPSRHQ